MTNKRDDSGHGRHAEGEQSAKRLPPLEAGDRELVTWAIHAVADPLLQDGLASSELLRIAGEALHDYARHRAEIEDPRAHLVEAILNKARRYMRLRGIEPPPVRQERAPNLLDVIAMKDAVDTLTADVRTALHLIYLQKWTLERVAAHLDVPVAYLERMVGMAIDKLWELWWKKKG